MFSRRSLTIFASAFAVILLAGVAFAQVGSFTPDAPDPEGGPGSASAGFTAGTATDADLGSVPLSQFENPADEEVADDTTTAGSIADAGPSTLVILHPTDGDRFDEKTVRFSGVAPIGWAVSAGTYSATVDGSGNWHIDLILWPGSNPATITATGPNGAVQTAQVTAFYDVPEGDSPPESAPPGDDGKRPPDEVAFSARQVYGESRDRTPTEVIVGTAPSQSTIYVVSAYGSTTATSDRFGRWEARVTFVDAPVGETFDIVVEADSGGRAVFEFTRKQPAGDSGDRSDRPVERDDDERDERRRDREQRPDERPRRRP